MFIVLIWAPQKQTLRQEVKHNTRHDLSFFTHLADSFHPVSCSSWNVMLIVNKELTLLSANHCHGQRKYACCGEFKARIFLDSIQFREWGLKCKSYHPGNSLVKIDIADTCVCQAQCVSSLQASAHLLNHVKESWEHACLLCGKRKRERELKGSCLSSRSMHLASSSALVLSLLSLLILALMPCKQPAH